MQPHIVKNTLTIVRHRVQIQLQAQNYRIVEKAQSKAIIITQTPTNHQQTPLVVIVITRVLHVNNLLRHAHA